MVDEQIENDTKDKQKEKGNDEMDVSEDMIDEGKESETSNEVSKGEEKEEKPSLQDTEEKMTDEREGQEIDDERSAKLAAIQSEIEQVMNGKHEEYKKRLQALQDTNEMRKANAKMFMEIQMRQVQIQYESELQLLQTGLEQDVNSLKQSMIDNLLTKQKTIEHELEDSTQQEYLDLQESNGGQETFRKRSRRSKDDSKSIGSINYNPSRRNYNIGLTMNYRLSNAEVTGDLNILRS